MSKPLLSYEKFCSLGVKTKGLLYYDNTNNTEIKEDTLDFPIDITMKVSDDPDDVMNVSQSLSNIDNKFYRALAMFQIKDFQTAK